MIDSDEVKRNLDLISSGQPHIIVKAIIHLNNLLDSHLKINFISSSEYKLNHSNAMCSNCGKNTPVDTSQTSDSDLEKIILKDLLSLSSTECQYCGNLAYFSPNEKPPSKPNNTSTISLPLPPDIDVVDEDFDVEAFQAWRSLVVPVVKTQLYYQQTGV